MNTDVDRDRIRAIRRESLALLDRLTGQAAAFDLAPPYQGLIDLRRKLADDTYTVLVVGEAKRGKSTFVNALIGRRILPIDVEVATSQVFRIQNAEQDAFRVRFEDESVREISANELGRYGSQVEANRGEAIRLNQIVRWIEIDTPTQFIPANITLLDTPGLGSLYAAHAQVTQRFVPFADAVIFALDSGQPVTSLELDFIKTILEVTPNILFIQTKIDQQRRDHWETIQQRNQEILAKTFGDRLPDTHVWPIGSRLLLQGAETSDDDFVIVSRQRELAVAMEQFLFRAVGWSRIEGALTAAAHYHATGQATLAARRDALTGQRSIEERDAILAQANRRRQEFNETWGNQSPRRRALAQDLHNAGRAGGQRFADEIGQDGTIARDLEARIEALTDLTDIRFMGGQLGKDVVSAALKEWNETGDEVRRRYTTLLSSFVQDAEAMSWVLSVEPPTAHLRAPRGLRSDWLETLPRASRQDEGGAAPVVRNAIDMLMLVGILAPPVGVAAAAASLAWSTARLFLFSDKAQVNAAKLALRTHLDESLDQVAAAFLSPIGGGPSLVDQYFARLEAEIAAQIQAAAERQSAEAEAEISRLMAANQLDGERRREAAAEIARQATVWDTLGGALTALLADLDGLDT